MTVATAADTTNGKWGQGLTQNDLMEKDTVLVLNDQDEIIGSASKKESHVFSPQQPRAILHRAFSVFLFDKSDGRLLLQQRASTKITFPNVWTNTCCSHPLHGMEPSEVDTPEDVASGDPKGAKYAAMRKLEHELGIPTKTFQTNDFKFLTRLHYWAADTVTHGNDAPWGEHEIDYVLFVTVDKKENLVLKPHPDEVDAVKWVTVDELLSMLKDKSLLFSPWFRLIVQKWLVTWWQDLDKAMTTNAFCDYKSIHEFDPPPEHLGGAGKAKFLFKQGDESKKQGAYGKVTVHKESKLKQIMHLDEVFAAFTLLYVDPLKSNLDAKVIRERFDADDLAFCDDILVKVSRSFAAVIRQLPDATLVDILVFYLVLRALDTLEDDMFAYESVQQKVKILQEFHTKALVDPEWRVDGIGEADEKRLLQEFPKCHRIYKALSSESQAVIADITKKMAFGMTEFVDKDLGQGTINVEEYNRYCHFVAGLVGEGLSRLFAATKLEHPSFAKETYLSNQMGLFLQKTNIIRDYLEDYVDKRAFWPQTVWKKYSETGELGYFTKQDDPKVQRQSVECLNELVTDALELAPDCLAYMEKLRCAEVFRFCAIPQVMAIATLDKLYANADVFTGVVKIRKGLSCKLILNTNNVEELHEIFRNFAVSVKSKANKQRENGVDDPSFDRTVRACDAIIALTSEKAAARSVRQTTKWVTVGGILTAAAWTRRSPRVLQKVDSQWHACIQLGMVAAGAAVYWLGPWGAKSNLQTASQILQKK